MRFISLPAFVTTTALCTACALCLSAHTAHALDVPGGTLTAKAGAVSDYTVRGISRSDKNPTLQGALDYQHESGVYAKGAAALVDLNSDKDANVETTLGAGYRGNYEGIMYDAGANYVWFPDADNSDLNYLEMSLGLDYDFEVFQAGVSASFSPDYMGDSGVGIYYGSHISAPVYDNLTAHASLGYQFVQDDGRYITDSGADWGAGLSYDVEPYGVDVGLDYTDTSYDKKDCREQCGAKAIVSVSKSW